MQLHKKLFLLLLFPTLFFASDLNWLSFEAAYSKAKNENKIILVDFYTDWCGWCKKMDKETYANPEIQEILKDEFVVVKINPEKQGLINTDEIKMQWNRFASEVGVRGYPATAFFTSDLRLIEMVPGYQDPQSMKSLLDFMMNNHYEQLSFQDYRLFTDLQKMADSNNSTPEVDYVLGYFYMRFFDDNKKAHNKFLSALNENLSTKEVYAALHLTDSMKNKNSKNWLEKAQELGYKKESELDELAVEYVKKIFSSN